MFTGDLTEKKHSFAKARIKSRTSNHGKRWHMYELHYKGLQKRGGGGGGVKFCSSIQS